MDRALEERSSARPRGSHRLPPPPSMRGKLVVAAVAAGAFVTAGQSAMLGSENSEHQTVDEIAPLAAGGASGSSSFTGVGGTMSAPEVLPIVQDAPGDDAVGQMVKSTQMEVEVVAAEEEAARPKFWVPSTGTFTSGWGLRSFGSRFNENHLGIDIANAIGTPIMAAHDGVVTTAGSASGFGLWVKVQAADGTTTVYGHIDSYSVRPGQVVKAGEQIAVMGNRGDSTGPHLHFEVWDASNQKIDPQAWLAERGVYL
ncbi:Peptidase family M23 [Actinoalloteichus hymeniacidonis]|uniref:Peptidase family M23 n=2 Tax=Actinoalloteichus hymeniacidonis TaxID=340345 RepID=A0AAC9N1B0_9PSEU|nr:Peptidase family M23 [Actinoalloteichus hymeniacidonis]